MGPRLLSSVWLGPRLLSSVWLVVSYLGLTFFLGGGLGGFLGGGALLWPPWFHVFPFASTFLFFTLIHWWVVLFRGFASLSMLLYVSYKGFAFFSC